MTSITKVFLCLVLITVFYVQNNDAKPAHATTLELVRKYSKGVPTTKDAEWDSLPEETKKLVKSLVDKAKGHTAVVKDIQKKNNKKEPKSNPAKFMIGGGNKGKVIHYKEPKLIEDLERDHNEAILHIKKEPQLITFTYEIDKDGKITSGPEMIHLLERDDEGNIKWGVIEEDYKKRNPDFGYGGQH